MRSGSRYIIPNKFSDDLVDFMLNNTYHVPRSATSIGMLGPAGRKPKGLLHHGQ